MRKKQKLLQIASSLSMQFMSTSRDPTSLATMVTQGVKGRTSKILTDVSLVLMQKLNKMDAVIVVSGDHSTPCVKKGHSDDPVPLLISGSRVKQDGSARFTENYAKRSKARSPHGSRSASNSYRNGKLARAARFPESATDIFYSMQQGPDRLRQALSHIQNSQILSRKSPMINIASPAIGFTCSNCKCRRR